MRNSAVSTKVGGEEERDLAKPSPEDLLPPVPSAAQTIGAEECCASWLGPALSPSLPDDVVGPDSPFLASSLALPLPRCGEV